MGQPFVAHLDALKLAQLCSSYCTNINTNYFIILNCIAEFMHCIFCYFSPKLRLDIGLELDRIKLEPDVRLHYNNKGPRA